jgi:DNA polymerase-3 subunit epsilon
MMRRVARVEIRKTAGELGALLLESRLIKELRPFFNVMSRRRRRIIVARRKMNANGYIVVELEPIDYLEIDPSKPILGLFKHTTQAKEFLTKIARERRLCHKLLKLEQSRTYCFAYHLGRCDGACMGEELAEHYNARVDVAFEERRICAWPYDGPVVVEERIDEKDSQELFVVDNWCLLGSILSNSTVHVDGQHRFDYDSYRILYRHLSDRRNAAQVHSLGSTYRSQDVRTIVLRAMELRKNNGLR